MARRNSRKVEVRVTSTAKDFDRGFAKARRSTQTFDQQMRDASQSGLKGFNSNLDIATRRAQQLVGVFAAAATAKTLFNWAGGARDSANALNESINAVNVTFGEGADKILRFGATAADSVGLANSAFNQAVVPIGSLLRNFGFDAQGAADASVVLTQRAADLASVMDTDVQDALTSISSGLQGQAEPMLKYGSAVSAARVEQLLLNQGIVESKSAITDADNVLGRYLLILEDTERVSGDFAATSEDNANATRRFEARLEDLRARVGQAVIPVFDQLLETGEDLLPTFEDLAITVIPALVEAFGGFIAGVGELVQFFAEIPEATQKATVGVGALGAALALIYTNPVIAGLAAVAAGITIIGNNARENRTEVDLLRQDIEDLGSIQIPTVESVIGKIPQKDLDLLKQVGIATDQIIDSLERGTAGDLLSGLIADYYDPTTVRDFTVDIQQLLDTQDALVHLQEQANDAQAEADRLRKEAGVETALRQAEVLAQQTANLNYELTQQNDVLHLSDTRIAEVTEQYKELDKQIQSVADSYSGQLTSSLSGFLDVFTAAPELEAALGVDKLAANAGERLEIIGRYSEALTRLQDEGLFALAQQFADAGPQSVNTIEAVVADIDAGGATAFELNDTIDAAQTAIEGWAAQMGEDFALATVPVIDQARGFGAQFAEAVAAGISEQQLDLLFQAQLIPTRRDSNPFGFPSRITPGGVEGRASGGRVTPGRPYIVGERGPEPFIPDQPGTVLPNSYLSPMLRQASGSGATTIHNEIHVDARNTGGDAGKIADKTVRELSREMKKFDGGQRRP